MILFLMPTFSRFQSGFMVKAVESILSQENCELRLCVVDDGSVDGSQDYLEKLAKVDDRVKVLRKEKNVGLPALTLAEGFVKFGDDAALVAWAPDDVEWLPGSAALMERRLLDSDSDVVYGLTTIKMPGGAEQVHGKQVDWDLQLLGSNQIGQAATLMKREALLRVGWPDPAIALKRYNDWDLWCRAHREGIKFTFLDRELVLEHGFLLPDSLGRSVDDLSDVAVLFAATNRSNSLNPCELENRSIYTWPRLATVEQRERILQAFAQHHLRTNSWDSFLRCKDPEFLDLLESLGLIHDEIAEWYVRCLEVRYQKIHQNLDDLQIEIWKKQNYIDEQNFAFNRQASYLVALENSSVLGKLFGLLRYFLRGTVAGLTRNRS